MFEKEDNTVPNFSVLERTSSRFMSTLILGKTETLNTYYDMCSSVHKKTTVLSYLWYVSQKRLVNDVRG